MINYLASILLLIGVTNAQYWHHGLQDTPEVAAAKVAHFAAVEKAKFGSSHLGGLPTLFAAHDSLNQKYHGPIALPPGYDKHGAPLPVLDTPEVAEEKAKHLALVAKKRAWYDEQAVNGGFEGGHAAGFVGGAEHSLLGGNEFIGGGGHHHQAGAAGIVSNFHDGGFHSGLGFQSGFRPSAGYYGGESDFKFHGGNLGAAFSPGFGGHVGGFAGLGGAEKETGFVGGDHHLERNERFHDHF